MSHVVPSKSPKSERKRREDIPAFIMPHETMSETQQKGKPTHYEVLSIPNLSDVTKPLLKSAYRRALLINHPDKSRVQSADLIYDIEAKVSPSRFSIDQITKAFNVLNDPKSRATYDQELRLRPEGVDEAERQAKQIFKTGFETVDLDDLEFDEEKNEWYRSCRCGDERGFLVLESDLEDASEDGEIGVGCRGCSLWIRVLFGVVEDD